MRFKSSLIKYSIPILILSIAIVIVMALVRSKPVATQKQVEELAWNVTAQKAEFSAHKPIIRLYGQLISRSPIEISSAIEAQVEKRWVENGEYVNKDQVLLTFDPTKYQLVHEQRKAETEEIEFQIKDEINRYETDKELLQKEKKLLQIAENAVRRAQTLEKSEMASDSQMDDALKSSLTQQIAITQRASAIRNHSTRLSQLKSKLAQAKTRLALAKQDFDFTEIRSPVNGYIHNVSVNLGEQVSRGKVIISLFDSEQREIRALLPEKYSYLLQKALSEKEDLIGFAETENYQKSIKLDRVSGNIDRGLAGSYVYFKLSEPGDVFLTGQTLDITLNLPAVENSIALPHDALYGTDSIYKIVDDHLQRLEIDWLGETLIDKRNARILIRSPDIGVEDLLLTSKFANAAHGLKVNISDEK